MASALNNAKWMMDQSIKLSHMKVFANVLSGIRDDTSLYENMRIE